ncbi:histidine acid phosphatase [Fragilaria crotonensis]|nr:histidine acid phosphatase [Fragilaria crotonensis]
MTEVARDTTPPPPPAIEVITIDTKTDLFGAEHWLLPEVSSPRKELKKKSKTCNIFIPAATPDEPDCPSERIRLGICAMDKKARSKPMGEILSRLDEKLFRVVFFGDKMIQNEPVEDWPVCDVLIAFYSAGEDIDGYPLAKAKAYAALRKPVILNDLEMQEVIKDRRKVYDLLEASGIDVPRHIYMSRDGYVSSGSGGGNGSNETELEEHDDHIVLNGVQINKPFVEKPVDADDHNIAIYYPSSAGGGCKKLFRKIGNRSSEFYPDVNEVRRDGSYIYEAFVVTQGTDVKMYTVGPEYGHAEARKSPTVDGKVERNSDGKEVRFPVILTEGDSLVSYVCDVNGWSFVKNSRKYYDDCAQILTEHMLASVKPKLLQCFSTLDPMIKLVGDSSFRKEETTTLQRVTRILKGEVATPKEPSQLEKPLLKRAETGTIADGFQGEEAVSAATTLVDGAVPVREIPDTLTSEPASMCPSSSSSVADDNDARGSRSSRNAVHPEELRCVIAVIRHGDRTPKQKLKVNTTEPHLLEYFHAHTDNCHKDLKVKAKAPMVEFLGTVKKMIAEKVTKRDLSLKNQDEMEILYKLMHMRDVLERWKIAGLNRKLQIKPRDWAEFQNDDGETFVRCTELQLILKWGGNLTKLGEKQSIHLGQNFRHSMYPDAPGGGILRLHSTFRHDLKIKTSDEGRVMKTAAAFAKGLLELEGEIPPILVSLVHKENESIHMLDPSGNKEVKMELDECKDKVNVNLQRDVEFSETTTAEHAQLVGPEEISSLHKALKAVGNPRQCLFKIHNTIGELLSQLEEMLGLISSGDENQLDGEGLQGDDENLALSGVKLYKGETLLELTERWRFIHSRLYDEDKDTFDLSRIPDVHDNVRFDMLHNPHIGLTTTLEKLYHLAKSMADCLVPQEYGTTIAEKRSIGTKMCRALLEKIKYDLIIARTDNQTDMRYMINMEYGNDLPITTMGRRIRTRLYFTSESHLHTLLNVLRFGGSDLASSPMSEEGKKVCAEAPELCYLTQVIFRLFEDTKRDADDPQRYRVELLFSPGATATPMHMAELDRDSDSSRFDTDPLKVIGRDNLSCQEVEEFLNACITEGHTEEDTYELASNSTTMDEFKRRNKAMAVANGKADDSGKWSCIASTRCGPRADTCEVDTAVQSNLSKKKKKKKEKKPDAMLSASDPPRESTAKGEVASVEDGLPITYHSNPQLSPSEPEVLTPALSQPTAADDDDPEKTPSQEEDVDRMAKILARQWYWRGIALASFLVGAGCLFLSMNMKEQTRYRRRFSRNM